jgi:predicted TIM-barrel fold metal-dependent hydrolase
LYHQQLPEVTELVTRCPDVTFVLDHLAKPPIRAGGFEPWATDLRELARRPNCLASALMGQIGVIEERRISGSS